MANFKAIQEKWQKKWEDSKIFKVSEKSKKPKFYCLEMFPYPSGKLHMGHVRNYVLGDSLARFKRMNGFNVLYPMGYDSFGLPAENAAIKSKVSPKEWTQKCIGMMKEQQKQLGLSYDWDREIATYLPEYYKWNQWIFLKWFEKGLAYKKSAPINWCSKCNTVLANEQVVGGKCWRCKGDVDIKDLEQWFLKITDYADELLNDLDKLEHWPEKVKIMQKNWIGKSHGTMVNFKLKDSDKEMPIFTTRADTLYGVTFMVFAPEHPMIMELVEGTKNEKAVKEFIKKVVLQDRFTRTAEDKEKEGMFIGRYAINPLTNEEIPIYIANFVLLEYGTGAIMAVPAHDQRDFEFAKKFKIPVKVVISPTSYELKPEKMSRAYVEDGVMVNSEQFNGSGNRDAIEEISKYLEKKGWGERTVQYKLRDWLISRQRYWGTPIPIIYCEKCGAMPVPEDQLPVVLPEDVQFTGKGNPMQTSSSFVNTKCPKCSGNAKRETDTMDTFVDSSWYFLRYCSPKEDALPFNKAAANYWMPVNQYIGGIEHAIMHLLYARFFTKALRDLGLAKIDEPFTRLLCQGMVTKDGAKMSKSIGNVVDPGEIIEKYSADTARLFMLFSALPEKELEWSDKGVEASFKFLNRAFRLVEEKAETFKGEFSNRDKQLVGKQHRTIKKVTEQIEKFQFSLAIGTVMEFVNAIYKYKEGSVHKEVFDSALESLTLLLSPFAPHIAEEMWAFLGKKEFVSVEKWPQYDEGQIDVEAEAAEELIHNTIADIHSVLELIKVKKPKKIKLFVSAKWKYDFFKELRKQIDKTRDVKEIIKNLMATELKEYGKEITKLVPKLLANVGKIPEVVLDQDTEFNTLQNSKEFLKSEFESEVEIVKAEQSKEPKAKSAMPGKTAIVIE
ncbi:leucine--tRNA ligase [Candidatus Woesearchaeota archaeon]|nr:leucine--tRNA ligase [Candidatus Woesearchaeota archaeon]